MGLVVQTPAQPSGSAESVGRGRTGAGAFQVPKGSCPSGIERHAGLNADMLAAQHIGTDLLVWTSLVAEAQIDIIGQIVLVAAPG